MRMIDADKFKEDLLKLWDYSSVDGITDTTVLKQVISDLDNAPTVSEITKEKLSIAYDQGYKDGRDNWLQEEHKGDLIRPIVNCKDCDGYEAGYNAGYADGIRGADWNGDDND